jgi:endo-1,4-beta-xylanase
LLWSRRRLLAAAAQAALAAPFAARGEAIPGLRQIAESRGLLFGSVILGRYFAQDRDYEALAARECNLFVCDQLQWDDVEPRQFVDDFGRPDADYAWAGAHGMQFRGHALLWGEHVPGWFHTLPDRAAAVQALTNHITRTCRHFAGHMQSWNVVNEPIKIASERPDGLRRTAFLEQIGPEYLDIAFRAARAADPKAKLVLNEFDIELDLPRHARRRRALYGVLDGFKARGTPIDTVGLESHLAIEQMPHFDARVYDELLRELTSRGLDIMLSELDVIDRGAPSDIAQRDAAVADAYRRYLDVALANKAVKAVITWGLTDRYSWITNGHYPETVRSDGLPPRPLPYDADYAPKPAYIAIAEALNGAPRR